MSKPLKICFACTAFRGKYRVTKKDNITWWSVPYGQNPWEKAIILDPEKRATFCEIGLTLWKEAIDDFTKTIKFNPYHETAYFQRAMAKEEIGDREGCCSDLKIALDPVQFSNNTLGIIPDNSS